MKINRPANPVNYNREAWNLQARMGNRWTVPFSDDVFEKARTGEWHVVLTPNIPVPPDWFPAKGSKLLGLASGGGQQCPLFAAAGFEVTSFDISSEQLNRDFETARKHDLKIQIQQGDMNDLTCFEEESFDVVFNPCSTGFIPDVENVYRQVARVLKKGGVFMTGFVNPLYYLFDVRLVEQGEFKLKYSQPYSDFTSLDDDELNIFMKGNEPLVFGHSIKSHFLGPVKAGMQLTDLFEDYWGGDNPVDRHFPAFVAARYLKIR